MAKKAEKLDVTGKSPDELKDTLLDLKKQQFNLRFQLRQGQLANTQALRAVRRDIARVQTAQGAANNPVAAKAAKPAKAKKVKAEGDAAPAKKTTKKPAAKKAAE